MSRKPALLATSAVVLLSLASPSQSGELYVSVLGGVNWQSDAQLVARGSLTNSSTWTSNFGDMDPNAGYLISAALGTSLDRWIDGLSAELEVGYRRNSLDGQWTHTSFFSSAVVDAVTGPIDGHVSTFSIMANAWYEFDAGLPVRPYVGGGVGWARANAEGAFQSWTTTFDQTESGFAWQLGAGVTYDLKPGMKLGLDYRYFDGPSLHNVFSNFNSQVNVPDVDPPLDNQNHAVALRLQIDIN